MQVWVEGELSGFSRPSSGHWYFSLKDRKCQVRCAMFRGMNQRIRALPKEGDQVRIRGKVTLYENRGDFQIIVEHIEPAGRGGAQQGAEVVELHAAVDGGEAHVERRERRARRADVLETHALRPRRGRRVVVDVAVVADARVQRLAAAQQL